MKIKKLKGCSRCDCKELFGNARVGETVPTAPDVVSRTFSREINLLQVLEATACEQEMCIVHCATKEIARCNRRGQYNQ